LAIVTSIVGLAQSFGLELVAEGVETRLAATTLLGLGCTRAQGFLFAKPMTDQEAEWVLDRELPLPLARPSNIPSTWPRALTAGCR
jgi:EAL domain-containing protein (putative c-di-GMP-specific phosphodiesterase class I)